MNKKLEMQLASKKLVRITSEKNAQKYRKQILKDKFHSDVIYSFEGLEFEKEFSVMPSKSKEPLYVQFKNCIFLGSENTMDGQYIGFDGCRFEENHGNKNEKTKLVIGAEELLFQNNYMENKDVLLQIYTVSSKEDLSFLNNQFLGETIIFQCNNCMVSHFVTTLALKNKVHAKNVMVNENVRIAKKWKTDLDHSIFYDEEIQTYTFNDVTFAGNVRFAFSHNQKVVLQNCTFDTSVVANYNSILKWEACEITIKGNTKDSSDRGSKKEYLEFEASRMHLSGEACFSSFTHLNADEIILEKCLIDIKEARIVLNGYRTQIIDSKIYANSMESYNDTFLKNSLCRTTGGTVFYGYYPHLEESRVVGPINVALSSKKNYPITTRADQYIEKETTSKEALTRAHLLHTLKELQEKVNKRKEEEANQFTVQKLLKKEGL